MNLELILVAAVLVVLVALPFIFLPILQNSGSRALNKKFEEQVRAHGLNISIKDSWTINILGLDPSLKKMVFAQRGENDIITEVLDLKQVKSCKPLIDEITRKKEGRTENFLNKVELEISFKDNETKKYLCLYDSDIHISQDLEIKHAQKWAALISEQLYITPALKKTA